MLTIAGSALELQRGEAFCHAGDEADYCFKVETGLVRLARLLMDGRRHVADFCGAGEIVGLDGGDTFCFTAEAVTPVRLTKYRRRDLENQIRIDLNLQSVLLKLAQRNVSRLQERVLAMGCQSAKERLASFLLMMARRRSKHPRPGSLVDLPMTRQDIGDYLGLTIETVSRSFGDLKRAGTIILLSRNQIRLIDIHSLRLLAEGDDGDKESNPGLVRAMTH